MLRLIIIFKFIIIKFNFVINFLVIINSFGVLVLICLHQYDIKSIIAISSIVHIRVINYKNNNFLKDN